MKALLALLCLAMVGCGTLRPSPDASYAVVTVAKSGGVYGVVSGDVLTCKITTKGNVKGWRLKFWSEKCAAEFEGDE